MGDELTGTVNSLLWHATGAMCSDNTSYDSVTINSASYSCKPTFQLMMDHYGNDAS